MQHIQTVTVGSGGAASITFSAIPATFTDLVVLTSLRTSRSSVNEQIFLRLNNATSGASQRELDGFGDSVASFSDPFIAVFATASSTTASTFSNSSTYIPNYLSTVAKSVSSDSVIENNATTGTLAIIAGLQTSSAAVTSIVLIPRFGTTLLQHSSASLYGITAGSDGITAVS